MRWVVEDERADGPVRIGALPSVSADPAAAPDALDALFGGPELATIRVGAGSIWIERAGGMPWDADLAGAVDAALRARLERDDWIEPLQSAGPVQPPSIEAVQAAVDTAIGAMAASHGGAIEVIGVLSDHVLVAAHGACRGCASIDDTLVRRATTAIQGHWPELTRIEHT